MSDEPDKAASDGGKARRSFRFFPPSIEEQRAFFVQLGGALLALLLIGGLFSRTEAAGLRGVLIGAAAGVLFLVARAAWQLETKAARAEHGEIAVRDDGFAYTDRKGEMRFIFWPQIVATDVRAGRLHLAWQDETKRENTLSLGARELENGMELIQLLVARGQSTPPSGTPTNFIPLQPK